MAQIADGKQKHPMYAHPGFIQGEAFGVLFKPSAADYPVKILSVELVMGSPPKAATNPTLHVVFEIWNDDSTGVAPTSTKPLWTISVMDFFNSATQKDGMPIVGNTGMVYDFDWSKPENHPPLITSGTVRVMVRVAEPSQSLAEEWGTMQCVKEEVSGIPIGCGCSKLAPLTDTATTLGVNLVHIFWPLGECTGVKAWKFVEQVKGDGIEMKGDFVLRMGVESSGAVLPDAGPTDAGGVAVEAGPTADVPGPDLAKPEVAAAKPVVELVSPAAVPVDTVTAIEIIGQGFAQGLAAKVGKHPLSVSKVTAQKIEASVMPGVPPGTYAVIVENPDGQIGFKDNALTVLPAVEPDAGPADTGPDDVGAPDSGPAKKPMIQLVTPASGPVDQTVAIEIIGEGFQVGAMVKVSSTSCAVEKVLPTKISAKIPPGLPAGVHPVIVENPDGQVAILDKAYTAEAAKVDLDAGNDAAAKPVSGTRKADDSSCRVGRAGSGGVALGLLLVALALLAARRRPAPCPGPSRG
jgi:hypothetical protein